MLPEKGTFGYALKLALLENGLTQKELAMKVRTPPSMVSMVISGKAIPSPDLVKRIARALDLDYLELLALSGAKLTTLEALHLNVSSDFAPRIALKLLTEKSSDLKKNLEAVTLYFAPRSSEPDDAPGSKQHFLREEDYWVQVFFDPNSAKGVRARLTERVYRREPTWRPYSREKEAHEKGEVDECNHDEF